MRLPAGYLSSLVLRCLYEADAPLMLEEIEARLAGTKDRLNFALLEGDTAIMVTEGYISYTPDQRKLALTGAGTALVASLATEHESVGQA